MALQLSGAPQTYTYSFSGLPPTPACSESPTSFTPASGTVTVPPGQCITIPVTIGRPAGMNAKGQTGCYQMDVQSVTLPCAHFTCTDMLIDRRDLCLPGPQGPATELPVDSPTTLGGVLTNTSGASLTGTYRLTVLNEDTTPDTHNVSLNGLPPGVPVTGSLALTAGASADLSFVAEFVESNPNHVHTILIETALGGGGYEALTSVSLENVIPEDGNGPFLDITRWENSAVIDWSGAGTLQMGDDLGGPWTGILEADTPYVLPLSIAPPRQLFRVMQ